MREQQPRATLAGCWIQALTVMAGLVPAISMRNPGWSPYRDRRDNNKPGDDIKTADALLTAALPFNAPLWALVARAS
jgi:hypothetical protein